MTITLNDIKKAIKKAENDFGAVGEDAVYVDVYETIRIVGKHNDILIDLNNPEKYGLVFLSDV